MPIGFTEGRPPKGEGVKVNINASSEVPDDKHLVTTFSNLPDVPLKSLDRAVTCLLSETTAA